ncbi:hypothetical protein [Sulfuricurvum sp.]|uniref:hypothetical protein n=1 Tax=Sulfuricurvum sp. TaxID=2025608 RepID=UPI0035691195
MDDDKLKLILAVLGGVVFSLIFVLLAFVLPIKDSMSQEEKVQQTLEKISKGIKEGEVHPPPGEKH